MGRGTPDFAKGYINNWDVQKGAVVDPKDNDFSWVVRERKIDVSLFRVSEA